MGNSASYNAQKLNFTGWTPSSQVLTSQQDLVKLFQLDQASRVVTESRVDDIVHEMMAKYKIPGCLVSVRGGGMNIERAYGHRNVPIIDATSPLFSPEERLERGSAPQLPIEMNSFLRIGSLTKSMTATMILILEGEKKLSLSDTIQKYFPGMTFKYADQITILQMLNMTSGLPEYDDTPQFDAILKADPEIHWNINDLIRWGLKEQSENPDSYFPPETSWSYCNTGYLICGLIIEKLTGMSLASAFEKYLFIPQNMMNSYLPIETNKIADPHPQGYGNYRGMLENCTRYNPQWGYAAGAVISTVDDMHKWSMVMGKTRYAKLLEGVLTEYNKTGTIVGAVQETFNIRGEHFDDPQLKYYIGTVIEHGVIWHNGSIPSAETAVAFIPNGLDPITMVVYVNQNTLPEFVVKETSVTQIFKAIAKEIVPTFPLGN